MLAFLISACDSGGSGAAATPTTAARVHVTTTPAPNRIVPDPVEKSETTAAKTLPSFVTSAGPAIQALYQGAMDHPDAYSVIPCYCGCAMYPHAHMSLMNCFITNTAADGSITWTDHSMNCDICTGIAEMTVARVQANTRDAWRSISGPVVGVASFFTSRLWQLEFTRLFIDPAVQVAVFPLRFVLERGTSDGNDQHHLRAKRHSIE